MEAHDWDERYAEKDLVWSAEPNRFLPPEVENVVPGRALDLACGEGRNALWLASQGWEVTAVDFSQTAIDKARRRAVEHGVSVDWRCEDLRRWQPPPASFDLVIIFYLQVSESDRRSIVQGATRAVVPGGHLLVVAHDSSNLTDGVGGPQDPRVLYTAGDLLNDLGAAGLEVEVQRAEAVQREVIVDGGERHALDALLRVRRR